MHTPPPSNGVRRRLTIRSRSASPIYSSEECERQTRTIQHVESKRTLSPLWAIGLISFVYLSALFILIVSPKNHETNLAKAFEQKHDEKVTLIIVPTEEEIEILEDAVFDVTYPFSTFYGKWKYGREVINKYIHPGIEIDGCQADWHGFSFVCPKHQLVYVDIDREFVVLTEKHSTLTTSVRIGQTKAVELSNDPNIVPSTVRRFHSVPDDYVGTSRVNVGVLEYQGDNGWNQEDLNTWANWTKTFPAPKPTLIHGGTDGGMDVEALLDVTATCGVMPHSVCTTITSAGWILESAIFLANASEFFGGRPTSLSASWGWRVTRTCEDVAQSFCSDNNLTSKEYFVLTEFFLGLMSATQPTTLVASSGDAGNECRAQGGESCDVTTLGSPYPSSSSYFSAVGAGVLGNDGIDIQNPGCHVGGPLYPCGSGTGIMRPIQFGGPPNHSMFWTSGAGFNPYKNRTSSFVSKYLASQAMNGTLPPQKMFNQNGLATPDFVSIGHNWRMSVGSGPINVDGTSMSAPLATSAVISVVNENRVRHGRPGLGHAYYWLEAMATGCSNCFNKVEPPGYGGCTEETCCPYGFHSDSTVWDAVSGFGSPNVTAILVWDNSLW